MAFPGYNTTDYIQWDDFKHFPATALTVSLWIKTLGRNPHSTPLSYAVSTDSKAFVLCDVNPLTICLGGGNHKTTTINLDDGFWHHLVITWENIQGQLNIYKDGQLVNEWIGFQTSHKIPDGGTLILGQEQGVPGGGFESNNVFDGNVRGFSIWNTVRSVDDIRRDMHATFTGNEPHLVGYWPMELLKEEGDFLSLIHI